MLELKYFVLKPKAKSKDDLYARASQVAMYAYADNIEEIETLHGKDINDEARALVQDLRSWAGKETVMQERFKEGE